MQADITLLGQVAQRRHSFSEKILGGCGTAFEPSRARSQNRRLEDALNHLKELFRLVVDDGDETGLFFHRRIHLPIEYLRRREQRCDRRTEFQVLRTDYNTE